MSSSPGHPVIPVAVLLLTGCLFLARVRRPRWNADQNTSHEAYRSLRTHPVADHDPVSASDHGGGPALLPTVPITFLAARVDRAWMRPERCWGVNRNRPRTGGHIGNRQGWDLPGVNVTDCIVSRFVVPHTPSAPLSHFLTQPPPPLPAGRPATCWQDTTATASLSPLLPHPHTARRLTSHWQSLHLPANPPAPRPPLAPLPSLFVQLQP